MIKAFLQRPFRLATILLVAVIGSALAGYDLTIAGAQAVARYTARLSFLIFAFVFSISAWFVFFITYFPRLQGKLPGVGGGFVDFVVPFSLLLAIMGLRLTTVFYRKPATP